MAINIHYNRYISNVNSRRNCARVNSHVVLQGNAHIANCLYSGRLITQGAERLIPLPLDIIFLSTSLDGPYIYNVL